MRIPPLTALALVSLLALSACSSLREEHRQYMGREENLTQVIGNVWRLDYAWPGKHRETEINEALQNRAADLCAKNDLGMLPLSGSSAVAADESRTTGWLEFRCQRPVNVIKGGILSDDPLTFKIDVPGEEK